MAKAAKKEERNPWERQEKESPQAYEAFCIFRDTKATERSKRDVAHQLSKNESLIYKWASLYQWNTRVLEYDNWIERQAAAAAVERIVSMRKRHINIAMKMQETGLKALSNLNPNMMEVNEVRLFLKTALEIEKANRTDEVQHSQPKGPPPSAAPSQQGPQSDSSIVDDWVAAVLAADDDED